MAKTRVKTIITITLVMCAFALGATTLAVITVNHNMTSAGTITTTPNICVYSDGACTQNMTSVSWGSVPAGSSATQTIYVKNIGTGTMTLGMAVNNWSPSSASNYITLSWDKQGTQLPGGQSTTATLTLNVASNIVGITNFSDGITISGTG